MKKGTASSESVNSSDHIFFENLYRRVLESALRVGCDCSIGLRKRLFDARPVDRIELCRKCLKHVTRIEWFF